MFQNPTCPNLIDYTSFLYEQVGIPEVNLPPTSDAIITTLAVAKEIVNTALTVAPSIYVLAVYNLGADRLINYANDVENQTYFADLRAKLSITTITTGVMSSGADAGTSAGMLNPEQMQLLTFQDLQTLKTPYGRQYMAFAQMYGRTLWGVN